MTEGRALTEDDLKVINGLVARCRYLESEYLRTRSVQKGDELYGKIDNIRWTLRTDYNVNLPPYDTKTLPEGKGSA